MASQKKFVSNKLCLPLPTPKHNSTRTCPFHFLEKGLVFAFLFIGWSNEFARFIVKTFQVSTIRPKTF
jgi:hypothetical protein